MTTIYFGHDALCFKIEHLRNIYLANQNEKSSRHAVLLKSARIARFIFELFIVVINGTFIIFIFYPLLVYLFNGERVVIFPLFLPFIDETTDVGYAIITGCQAVWMIQTSIGLIGSDSSMALLLVLVRPMVDMFEISFDEMNSVLESVPRVKHSMELNNWLRNLILMHQEMTR